MKWKVPAHPLLKTLVGLAVLSSAGVVGCGSDITSPSHLEIADREVPMPEASTDKLPRPSGLEAQAMPNCVRLTWDFPAIGYTAILRCNGLWIAEVDARTFQFDDAVVRAPGRYRYSLSFGKGNSVGKEIYQTVTIRAAAVQKDPGKTSFGDN